MQIASLALKSGNALILKGGKEAINSNKAVVTAIRKGLSTFAAAAGQPFPVDAVQLVETREEVPPPSTTTQPLRAAPVVAH